MMRPRIASIREVRLSDEELLLPAFHQANAHSDPDYSPLTPAHWRWKFFENPCGLRATIGLDESGQVLAQYAGLPQRICLDGEWTNITQGVDSFSSLNARGLGRRGAFVQTGEVFARQYGAVSDQGDPWMWGFPVPRARRVGERFLGYQGFRAQPLLQLFRAPAAAPRARVERAALALLNEEAASFDALNESLLAGDRVQADRSAQTLAWRYAEHPSRTYQLLVQRTDAGELIGYALLTRGKLGETRGTLLCELVTRDKDEGALIAAAWGIACEQSEPKLIALLAPNSGAFGRYQARGFHVRGSSLFLVGRSYDRTYSTEFWREKWRMSLGDTDLS